MKEDCYFTCIVCETPHRTNEEASACCACEDCADKDKRIAELKSKLDEVLTGSPLSDCQAKLAELETQSQEGWDKYKELRKEVANNRYPELTAMVNAESVMESQSVLITKLQQDVAEADDAMCEAQWRFERAEATINKLREVAPKLVEVAEGGIRQ